MNYLYNGIELPALPEWDRETYPCAIICMVDYGWMKQTVLFVTPQIEVDNVCVLLPKDNHIAFTYDPESLTWGEPFVQTSLGQRLYEDVKWTNTDIYKPEGTLYLAASDPVPVSPVQINPAPLT